MRVPVIKYVRRGAGHVEFLRGLTRFFKPLALMHRQPSWTKVLGVRLPVGWHVANIHVVSLLSTTLTLNVGPSANAQRLEVKVRAGMQERPDFATTRAHRRWGDRWPTKQYVTCDVWCSSFGPGGPRPHPNPGQPPTFSVSP